MECHSIRIQISLSDQLCLSDIRSFVFHFSARPQDQSFADPVDLSAVSFLYRVSGCVSASLPVHLAVDPAADCGDGDESGLAGGLARPDQGGSGGVQFLSVMQIQYLLYSFPAMEPGKIRVVQS